MTALPHASSDLAHLQVLLLPLLADGWRFRYLACELGTPAPCCIWVANEKHVLVLYPKAIARHAQMSYEEQFRAVAAKHAADHRSQAEVGGRWALGSSSSAARTYAGLALYPWDGTPDEQARSVAAFIEANNMRVRIVERRSWRTSSMQDGQLVERLSRRVLAQVSEVAHADALVAIDLPLDDDTPWTAPFEAERLAGKSDPHPSLDTTGMKAPPRF